MDEYDDDDIMLAVEMLEKIIKGFGTSTFNKIKVSTFLQINHKWNKEKSTDVAFEAYDLYYDMGKYSKQKKEI